MARSAAARRAIARAAAVAACYRETVIVRIRRIGTSSVFLLAMTLYGIVGLLVGIVLAVVSTLEAPPGSEETFVTRLGPWSALVLPIAYGLIGGLAAAVAAALYNAASAVVGGVRVEVPDADLAPTGGSPAAGGAAGAGAGP